jgi:16S rRNA (guanine1516-N2)-methyltransferase
MTIAVTTSKSPGADMVAAAEGLARRLGGTYAPREGRSIDALRDASDAGIVIIIERGRTVCRAGGKLFFFHPNMAKQRVSMLRLGQPDPMAEALGLGPGDHLLDATLGLGADAIVAAYVVGESGRVVATESVAVIAEIVADGLRRFTCQLPGIESAMRRVEVVADDHFDFLRRQPDASLDVVYFDPMFETPLRSSVALSPLRELADHRRVSAEAVAEGRRVARRRVVVKNNRESPVWRELGITEVIGGTSSRVAYGIIRAEGERS